MTITIIQALQKGVEAHENGRLREADKYYRAIIGSYPNHPDANHNLGILIAERDDPRRALHFFKIALEANPNEGRYWLSYIDTLIRLNELKYAEQLVKKAEQAGLKVTSLDKVKNALDKAIEKNSLLKLELNNLTDLYNRGELSKGLAVAHELIKKFPRNPTVLNITGIINHRLGAHYTAIKNYLTALKYQPNSPQILNNLAAAFC